MMSRMILFVGEPTMPNDVRCDRMIKREEISVFFLRMSFFPAQHEFAVSHDPETAGMDP